MSVDLKQFHTYRFYDGNKTYTTDSRRKLAKKIVSLHKQGWLAGVDRVNPEHMVNGTWVDDPQTILLAKKYSNESLNGATPAPAKSNGETTLFGSMRSLARVLKITLSAGEGNFTAVHAQAIDEAMGSLAQHLEAYLNETPESEDEGESDENYHGDEEDEDGEAAE